MSAHHTSYRIRLRRGYMLAGLSRPIAEQGTEHLSRYYGLVYPDRVFFNVGGNTFSAVIGPDAELVRSEVEAS